jgi:hypothetical protein
MKYLGIKTMEIQAPGGVIRLPNIHAYALTVVPVESTRLRYPFTIIPNGDESQAERVDSRSVYEPGFLVTSAEVRFAEFHSVPETGACHVFIETSKCARVSPQPTVDAGGYPTVREGPVFTVFDHDTATVKGLALITTLLQFDSTSKWYLGYDGAHEHSEGQWIPEGIWNLDGLGSFRNAALYVDQLSIEELDPNAFGGGLDLTLRAYLELLPSLDARSVIESIPCGSRNNFGANAGGGVSWDGSAGYARAGAPLERVSNYTKMVPDLPRYARVRLDLSNVDDAASILTKLASPHLNRLRVRFEVW